MSKKKVMSYKEITKKINDLMACREQAKERIAVNLMSSFFNAKEVFETLSDLTPKELKEISNFLLECFKEKIGSQGSQKPTNANKAIVIEDIKFNPNNNAAQPKVTPSGSQGGQA